MEVCWAEHNNVNKKLKPLKHLFLSEGHSFKWSVLLSALKNTKTRKNLEAFLLLK